MRRLTVVYSVVLLALALSLGVPVAWARAAAPAIPAVAPVPTSLPLLPAQALYRYYEATGHNLGPPFKQFFDDNGGVKVFGLPLSELITDQAGQRQYFERAVLVRQPNSPDQIVVSDLGRQLTHGRSDEPFRPQPAPDKQAQAFFDQRGIRYFGETGHTLRGAFRSFWERNGGVAILGYPISELLLLGDDATVVQYFERARLEYRPAFINDPHAVQLGLLGSEIVAQQQPPTAAFARTAAIVRLATANTPSYPGSPEATNIVLAAHKLDGALVLPGAELSFLDRLGPLTLEAGYVAGGAIIGDAIVQTLAGGICQVSSALYEAALRAGLPIIERHSHSRFLSFFADKPGLEAAVYAPEQDLRWQNDMQHTLRVHTHHDAAAGVLHVEIWGIEDGRVTTVADPAIVGTIEPPPALWAPDETLAPHEARVTVTAQQGVTALVARSVHAADGTLLRDDRVETVYAPWSEMVRYGSGVQPPSAEQAACLLDGVLAPEAPTDVPTAQPPGASTALVLLPCNPQTPQPTGEATPEVPVEATPEPTREQPTDAPTPEPTVQPTVPIWVER